jgi:PAS domain S-box-containing protein
MGDKGRHTYWIHAMTWLAAGVLYTLVYLVSAAALAEQAVLWFRFIALLIPPLVATGTIAWRRHCWSGCQWLFWATVALGLVTSAVAHVGWTVDEYLIGRQTTWLGWHAVFVLFGGIAPLLALLAQPHRGPREAVAPTTAVDIAGLAVVAGFLYSFLVTAEDPLARGAQGLSVSLVALAELQQFLVFTGMTVAALLVRKSRWGLTYRRLAIGLGVNFAALSLSNAGILEGAYRAGFVYDVMWILPVAFYPWAVSAAPPSADSADTDAPATAPSRPWLIFAALVLIPLADAGLRRAVPASALGESRDLAAVVTVFSVLPLLLARLAVERAETRRADTDLRLLAAAMDQAEEFVLIFTANGRFVQANNAACRAFGYTRQELGTLAFKDLLAGESLEQVDELEKTTRAGDVWRGTFTHRRKDASTFPAACVVVPLGNDAGEVAHLVNVERDITENLQHRRQLIHAERLSAIGQLVSGVAHEINNPLQSIIGFSQLLIDAERRHDIKRDLEIVKAEATRAAKIVRSLLAFVHRSDGARSREDLNDLVRAAVSLRAHDLRSADIGLDERYADGLPPVHVDREEIEQIVLNLLLNAEQAIRSAPEGRQLTIRTAPSESGVMVEVANDGPSIPPEIAGKIFEPFFSTKDVGEGTGLGLSIALGIAQAHGGSLTLVDRESGACFRLTLPADLPGPVAAWSAEQERPALPGRDLRPRPPRARA